MFLRTCFEYVEFEKIKLYTVKVSSSSFKLINKHFSWETVLIPLIDYIKKFYYDENKKFWFVPELRKTYE